MNGPRLRSSRKDTRSMRNAIPAGLRLLSGLALSLLVLAGCDLGKVTVDTTSKVLVRAQPSLKQESSYDMASRAIPGALKTIEGFWVVDPDNERLTYILMEGYCQYGSGFVEDEWEQAVIAKNFERKDELSTFATKMFLRCMNYALRALGGRWQEGLFGDIESAKKLIES